MPHPVHLHLRVRDHIANLILDGRCRDGEPLPSVRALAARLGANPLTVGKAYQFLLESGIVEARRGIGVFVQPGGTSRLRALERHRFLSSQWPAALCEMKRLGFDPAELLLES